MCFLTDEQLIHFRKLHTAHYCSLLCTPNNSSTLCCVAQKSQINIITLCFFPLDNVTIVSISPISFSTLLRSAWGPGVSCSLHRCLPRWLAILEILPILFCTWGYICVIQVNQFDWLDRSLFSLIAVVSRIGSNTCPAHLCHWSAITFGFIKNNRSMLR